MLPGVYKAKNGRAVLAIRKKNETEVTEIHCNEIDIGREYYDLK